METHNSKQTIGKYDIYDLCRQSYPCKHFITDLETDVTKLLSGDIIFTMLANEGLSHPHFDEYEEYIRKRDFPTPEELYEKQRLKKESEERYKKQQELQRQRDEERAIAVKYSAGSYIERLKNRK